MRSYVLHLIRNMPCEGNLEGRYIGRTESPLALSSLRDLAGAQSRSTATPGPRPFTPAPPPAAWTP